MLVFVDESGDPGLKFGEGSSECFVVVAVIFQTEEHAHACIQTINNLRGELRMPAYREFRFSKSSSKIRMLFLRRVAGNNFRYLSFALNKTKVTGPGYQYKDSLYKNTVKMLFENALPILSNAIVYIDKSGGREFSEQLKKYLMDRMTNSDGSCPVKRVRTEDSHSNNLLQLADMVCGAVARKYRVPGKDGLKYWQIIRAKEVNARLWPTF